MRAIQHQGFSVATYRSPGPVASDYIESDEEICFITGPQGSGKTHASIRRLLGNHYRLAPLCRDGWIKSRAVVVRERQRALEETFLATSWFTWFSKKYPGGEWSGGGDRPAEHILRFKIERNGRMFPSELLVSMKGLGDNSLEENFKGWEGNQVLMNETDYLGDRTPSFLHSRLGRYPPKQDIVQGTQFRRAFGDFNPTDVQHWLYRDCVKEPKYTLFRQPSGLSAQAENIENLPDGYYQTQLKYMDRYDIKRLIHGEFGFARSGLPVYDDFRESVHVSRARLSMVPGFPLHGGFDGGQGMAPAGIFFQLVDGQILVLAEIGGGLMSSARFSENINEVLADRFRGFELGTYGADPQAWRGADREGGQLTWVDTVELSTGLSLRPAPTQEPALRQDAVKAFLPVEGDRPRLLICPSCVNLIAAFAGYYRFVQMQNGNYDTRVDKTQRPYCDLAEALEYGVLTLLGRAGVLDMVSKGGRAGSPGVNRYGRGGPQVIKTGNWRLRN